VNYFREIKTSVFMGMVTRLLAESYFSLDETP
jgi:hypothetical protein